LGVLQGPTGAGAAAGGEGREARLAR